MEEDFLSPRMSTIQAALLSLIGRPIGTVTGNVMGIGKVIALAHTMGMNRDPTHWKIDDQEKDLRKRLWWGIVIQDSWYVALIDGNPR